MKNKDNYKLAFWLIAALLGCMLSLRSCFADNDTSPYSIKDDDSPSAITTTTTTTTTTTKTKPIINQYPEPEGANDYDSSIHS